MSWIRNTAALFAGAALVLTPHLLPTSAATQARSAVVVAPSKVAPSPLIQGVVTDQFGRYVDDVEVQALRPNGTPVATSLTYASDREDGPQHGYFFLKVKAVGSYKLTLSKDGYRDADLGTVEVVRLRQKLSLGELEIQKRLAATATDISLVKQSVSTRDAGQAVVKVTTGATKKPAGTVEVREGRTVVGLARLKAGDKGVVTIVLDKLGKGRHDLKAYFLGSETLAASSTKNAVTLVVTKPKK